MPADIALIKKYFPGMTSEQEAQFSRLGVLYRYWNERVNVVSRKDIEALYEHHVLHSLGIAKVMPFRSGTKILDVGTGGGFPGIPLAILFPGCQFHLVDSIAKKIKVVNAVKEELKLENVTAEQARAEKVKGQYHFVVSRAVTQLPKFMSWVRQKFSKDNFNALPNGVLYLKGGDLTKELNGVHYPVQTFSLAEYFEEPFFETKKVVHVQR